MPMCSSTYWRRTSRVAAGRAKSAAAAARVTGISRMAFMVGTLPLMLLSPAPLAPAQTQAAARLVPFRDSIAPTLVTFEMIPVPGGTVTLDSPTGPRVVAVAPFWIGRTEVTWDEYDVWVYRLDIAAAAAAAAPGGPDSADATARPNRPYGAPHPGLGHHGYPP